MGDKSPKKKENKKKKAEKNVTLLVSSLIVSQKNLNNYIFLRQDGISDNPFPLPVPFAYFNICLWCTRRKASQCDDFSEAGSTADEY